MTLPFFGDVEDLLQLLAGLSVCTFCLSLICIPLLVARLPQNFFLPPGAEKRETLWRGSLKNISYSIARNTLGFLLLLAGIAMLFLPGQGLITLIIGITMMSFPYKQKLIYNLTRPLAVQRSLDWIRIQSRKETFYW